MRLNGLAVFTIKITVATGLCLLTLPAGGKGTRMVCMVYFSSRARAWWGTEVPYTPANPAFIMCRVFTEFFQCRQQVIDIQEFPVGLRNLLMRATNTADFGDSIFFFFPKSTDAPSQCFLF